MKKKWEIEKGQEVRMGPYYARAKITKVVRNKVTYRYTDGSTYTVPRIVFKNLVKEYIPKGGTKRKPRRKFNEGDIVRVKSKDYIPKKWRGRRVKIVQIHKMARTGKVYYDIVDLKTGKPKGARLGFRAAHLEEIGKKNKR